MYIYIVFVILNDRPEQVSNSDSVKEHFKNTPQDISKHTLKEHSQGTLSNNLSRNTLEQPLKTRSRTLSQAPYQTPSQANSQETLKEHSTGSNLQLTFHAVLTIAMKTAWCTS